MAVVRVLVLSFVEKNMRTSGLFSKTGGVGWWSMAMDGDGWCWIVNARLLGGFKVLSIFIATSGK